MADSDPAAAAAAVTVAGEVAPSSVAADQVATVVVDAEPTAAAVVAESVSLRAVDDTAFADHYPSKSARSRVDDLEVDRDYTTRLVSASGGFTSSVREHILSHPVVLKNRSEPGVASYVSSESRQVMRKGFDIGIASPGLRMLYDVGIRLPHSPSLPLYLCLFVSLSPRLSVCRCLLSFPPICARNASSLLLEI